MRKFRGRRLTAAKSAIGIKSRPMTYERQTPLSFIVQNVAKLGLGVIFIFYSVGFIVWQSFLGQYGVSIGSIFQFQFVSAACCYLLILITFMLPPTLLFTIRANNLNNKKSNVTATFVVAFWVFLVINIGRVAFPEKSGDLENLYLKLIVSLIVLHFAAWVIIKHTNDKLSLYQFLGGSKWFWIYLLCIIVVPILFSPSVDKWFLISTMVMYLTGKQYGLNAFDLVGEQSYLMTIMKLMMLISIFIGHCYFFGTKQFSKLPKSIGGGRPELAYLFPSTYLSKEFMPALMLTKEKGYIGPVAILAKTDKEVVFIKPEDLTKTTGVSAKSLRLELIDGIKYLPTFHIEN